MNLRQKALWVFVGLLLATSVAQGYYIRNAAAALPPPDWFETVRKEFFDDELFKPSLDPFKEFDNLPLLDQPWDGWFAKTKETDKDVVVELTIPGLDKDSLKVDVNSSRIRVAHEARKVHDHGEMESRFEQVLPVPEDADGRNARVSRDGDVVRITFPRKIHAIHADA